MTEFKDLKPFKIANLNSVGDALPYNEEQLANVKDPIAFSIIRDLTDLLSQERMAHIDTIAKAKTVERNSVIDDMTGLYNQGFGRKEHDRLHRAGPYGLAVIDLDGFKKVNDKHGHPMGDKILQRVGEIFRDELVPAKLLRETDVVSRDGGDEFVILLPHFSDGIEVAKRLEKIRSTISEDPFLKQYEIGASVGVAVFNGGTGPLSPLPAAIKEQADLAVYASKADGKNVVSLLTGTEVRKYQYGNFIRVPTPPRSAIKKQPENEPAGP